MAQAAALTEAGAVTNRRRALGLVLSHGRLSTCFQIVEPGYDYFFDPKEEGVVAYAVVGGWRVVCGAPVCSERALPGVLLRFAEACRAAGHRVVFFGVERPLIEALAAAGLEGDSVQIAEQPEWRPADYHTRGAPRRTLRAQVNRARNKGVKVRQICICGTEGGAIERLRDEVGSVLTRWLAHRRMSVMQFMVNLEPFDFPEHRRYFVAEQNGRAVGFLAAVPVPARHGWFFEDVIRAPDAPNGTAELLIHTALEAARTAGDTYVTLGMAPLAGVSPGPGRHRLLRSGLSFCYRRLTLVYAFAGLRRFKARFHPDDWVPQYLVTLDARVGIGAFQAVLRAFAGGGLVAFGWETARRLLGKVSDRLWAGGLLALAAMLIPWTALLALVDGARWFGDESTRWAWVYFDVAMIGALLGLANVLSDRPKRIRRTEGLPRQRSAAGIPGRRPLSRRATARRLALFLSGATLTDFVLSGVQAFNLHRAVEGWSFFVVFGAVTGPLVATAYLWGLAFGAGSEEAEP